MYCNGVLEVNCEPAFRVSRVDVNQKQEPFPGSESTPIFPPSCVMILWQIERPRPVPGNKIIEFDKTVEYSRLLFRFDSYTRILYGEFRFFFLLFGN